MQLTSNFHLSEFQCKCGCTMPNPVFKNIQKLAQQLQVLRNDLNKPIKINSAYRCLDHNRSIGSKDTSQHIKGKASDIVVKDMHPDNVYLKIRSKINKSEMTQGGLGRYNTFTHYDIRGTKARWDNRK